MAAKLVGEARAAALAGLKGWAEVQGRDAIRKEFRFKDFNAAFGFMALRYSFDLGKEADAVEKAIANVLGQGLRTGDIMQPGMKKVGTTEMGKAIHDELVKLVA